MLSLLLSSQAMYIVQRFNNFCSYWYKTVWVRESLLSLYIHVQVCMCAHLHVGTIQWNTSEGDNFGEFQVFVAIRESFLSEFGGMRSIRCWHKRPLAHIFFVKIVFSHQFTQVFSLESFPYTVHCHLVCACWYFNVCACVGSPLISSLINTLFLQVQNDQVSKVTNELP